MPPSGRPVMPARVAGPDDLEPVTTIITLAFAEDPVWGPAFGAATGPLGPRELWRAYIAVGFEVVGSFEGYVPGSVITTMWRPARR